MKRTVITKTLDGLDVVVGFDELRRNPIATKEIVRGKLLKSDEAKELERIATEIEHCYQAYKAAKRERDDVEIENLSHEIESLQSQISTLKNVLSKKKREFSISDAVFFDPPSGEYLLPDEEIDDLSLNFDNLDPRHYLLMDGTIVEDLRGSFFWEKVSGKWTRGKIGKLGETISGSRVRPDDLKKKDHDEIEKQRLEALSPEEKQAEKEQRIEAVKNAAALLKVRLEIEDDPDALSKAKAFLSEKKFEIESVYK